MYLIGSNEFLGGWPDQKYLRIEAACHTVLWLAVLQGNYAFLTTCSTFFAVRGDPAMVYSDQGTNLTKAAPYLQDEDPESWG